MTGRNTETAGGPGRESALANRVVTLPAAVGNVIRLRQGFQIPKSPLPAQKAT